MEHVYPVILMVNLEEIECLLMSRRAEFPLEM